MKVLLYFLVVFATDGQEYVVDGPMPIEDCAYAMLDASDMNPNQPSYACEAVIVRKDGKDEYQYQEGN